MKSRHKKSLFRQPVTHAKKKIHSWYTKSPLLVIGAIVLVVGVVVGASYESYQNNIVAKRTNDSSKEASDSQSKKADGTNDIKTLDKSVTTDSLKKASETKIDVNDSRAPTLTTGAGCVGIACYELGGFSLVASPKSVSITAGTYYYPITIRTADGSKVDWGGMPSSDFGVGTHGGNFFPGYSSSFTYYIEAREQAKGVHYLEFHATREKPKRQWAKVRVKVTVTPGPYYTISAGTASYTPWGMKAKISVPFTIKRFNGHMKTIYPGATLTCPNNGPVQLQSEVTGTYAIDEAIVEPFPVPGTCKIKFNSSDGTNYIFDNAYTIKVQ